MKFTTWAKLLTCGSPGQNWIEVRIPMINAFLSGVRLLALGIPAVPGIPVASGCWLIVYQLRVGSFWLGRRILLHEGAVKHGQHDNGKESRTGNTPDDHGTASRENRE
jgi:hypothetical protein